MRRTTCLAALAAGVTLLGGCASTESGTAQPDAATHTMPVGSVMADSEMRGGHRGHGEGHQHHHGPHASAPAGPSAAAEMVCGGDVTDDITRILALDDPPEPTSTWQRPVFTCTYDLQAGPLTLSVHDAADPRSGRVHFDAVRAELGETRPLKGMYGLGLPAYETTDGTVAFIRDGKTLQVDATALPAKLGPDDDMSRTELAYAVATSVLACWTEHS